MAQIARIEISLVDLKPKVKRTDAIQSFVSQETPIIKIIDQDGVEGVGYTYTIGTGGSSVIALLKDHLVPRLIGREADEIERLWRDLLFSTHATSVGAITSLALAAIDTALWDLRGKRTGLPLYRLAGGALRLLLLYRLLQLPWPPPAAVTAAPALAHAFYLWLNCCGAGHQS